MSSGTILMPPSPGLDGSAFFSNGTETETETGTGSPLVSYSIVQFPGKGNGFQVHEFIKCGQTLIAETATVIGPKQCSPLLCVECCRTFPDNPTDETLTHCSTCCLPLCLECFNTNKRPNHQPECDIFATANFKALTATNGLISSKADATKIFSLLTPLRLLLIAESDSTILEMEGNLSERANTMIFCYNQVYVVKFLHEKLFLDRRFSADQIQKVCGILDTNCYELGWKGTRARALFRTIARINHDCVPNSRKYFNADRRMIVVAARDIYPGEEVTLSYTPPLTSTPVRQLILQQTKCFQCHCLRCLDPSELGTNLSGLQCQGCKAGFVLPVNPMNSDSDYSCTNCDMIVDSSRCKMIIETAMRFAGQESGIDPEKRSENILSIIKNLQRFVTPSHQLITNLKLKLVEEVTSQEGLLPREKNGSDLNGDNGANGDSEIGEKSVLEESFLACQDLIFVCQKIAPGHSRLRGILSKHYHKIVEKLEKSGLPAVPAKGLKVLTPIEITQMFSEDVSSQDIN